MKCQHITGCTREARKLILELGCPYELHTYQTKRRRTAYQAEQFSLVSKVQRKIKKWQWKIMYRM